MTGMLSPDEQERLALTLEEAAQRVRMHAPRTVEADVRDHVDSIPTGLHGESIPGLRSPKLRAFRIEW